MATVILRDAIERKVKETRTVKQELRGSKCESCGTVFGMGNGYGDRFVAGQLRGMFDRGLGNNFEATVCSFRCAHDLMEGGWKDIRKCKPLAEAKAVLIWAEVAITELRTEEALISEWEAREESESGQFFSCGSPFPPDDNRGQVSFLHLSLVDVIEALDEVIGAAKKLIPIKNETIEKARRKLPSWCENAIESDRPRE